MANRGHPLPVRNRNGGGSRDPSRWRGWQEGRTLDEAFAGASDSMHLQLGGQDFPLDDPDRDDFERGNTDRFTFDLMAEPLCVEVIRGVGQISVTKMEDSFFGGGWGFRRSARRREARGPPCSATIRRMIVLLFISIVFAQHTSAGTLRFTAPPEWLVREPASSMRVAELTLPKTPADPEDGELVVYFFGGSGGSVEANLERWIGQMQQPDGRPSKDLAGRTERQVNSLGVTMLDISGTYVAEVRPGSTERHDKPGFRMRAAVVTTPKGPYFVKAVGPAETMARWNDAFEKFIASLRFEG